MTVDGTIPGVQEWLDLDEAGRRVRRAESFVAARREAESHNVWITVGDPAPEEVDGHGGELAGVPFGVKDNVDVAGFATTAGSPLLATQRPVLDGDLVALLRRAGAVVVGKTNLHELAFGGTSNNATYGAVRHPVDPSRVAGGSSGGSAAAVALGSVPFALGTDTGGSVTVPSAFCGVVGFRPTTGRYPGSGVVNLSTTRDTIGLHTRSVRDARIIDRVITRSGGVGERGSLADLTLGRIPSRFEEVEGEVGTVVERAIDVLRDHGARIIDVPVPDDLEIAGGPGLDLVFFEAARLLTARVALGTDRPEHLRSLLPSIVSPDVRRLVEHTASEEVTIEDYDAARGAREELRRSYEQAFAESGAAALLAPTSPVLAPPIGDDDLIEVDGRTVPTFATIIRNAGPGTVAGVPMLSLPAGRSAAGLPVGLCLEGRFGDDRALLALGEQIEDALT